MFRSILLRTPPRYRKPAKVQRPLGNKPFHALEGQNIWLTRAVIACLDQHGAVVAPRNNTICARNPILGHFVQKSLKLEFVPEVEVCEATS